MWKASESCVSSSLNYLRYIQYLLGISSATLGAPKASKLAHLGIPGAQWCIRGLSSVGAPA